MPFTPVNAISNTKRGLFSIDGVENHIMSLRILTLLIVPGLAGVAGAADPAKLDLEARFQDTIRPFLTSYCVSCHSGEEAMAQFDLTGYDTPASVTEDHRRWALVIEKLNAKEMPPEASPKQPSVQAQERVVAWIKALFQHKAQENAGDPGLVLARRLSNSEYNYTIRDLTGVDIRPTREFPVDPANMAGFDNSGESLSMSPTLVNKYLQAAREVADHLVLKPAGIAFAPHPMRAETDRDKYCINQIIDFYKRQNTNYSDYFQTAWRYKHRSQLGKPHAALADFAAEYNLSPKYLATVWKALETNEDIGPLAKLQAMWEALPAPRGNQPDLAKGGVNEMRNFVVGLRQKIATRVRVIENAGDKAGDGQPFLMWRNRQYAMNRRNFDRSALQVEGEERVEEAPQMMKPVSGREAPAMLPRSTAPDPDRHVPAGQRERYEAAFAKFASVFPDAFYISERGRYFPDNTRDTGRHLSAGFHNRMGYFRDDQPLYELVLDEKQQKELDDYWRDLDFVAGATHRTYTQFYVFYLYKNVEARTDVEGGASSIDAEEIFSYDRIMQAKEHYLEEVRSNENPLAVEAVEQHFSWVNETIRWVEKAHIEAEPIHLSEMVTFAARAYRRPLTQKETNDLLDFYRSSREKGGLTHEEAMRDMVVRVLMSPHFCYRIDLVDGVPKGGGAVKSRRAGQELPNAGAISSSAVSAMNRPASTARAAAGRPLSDYALASRLSYFLWASMPDEELLGHAAAGDLHKSEVLKTQARRMLKDRRVRRLATEFGGNWLDFRRFEEHNAVDRRRFPRFNDELRQAMFEEPIHFIEDLIRHDRSVLDLLYAGYTFVNPVLAKHYGMSAVEGEPSNWVKVADARKDGRGGLLPMSVFLTKNAPGLRTSPVKRGYWVVRRLLGEEIPPPPAAVPELPSDEAKMELSLRDELARHRSDPGCASCHARFDSFGLALEGYGPVGEVRTQDLAGRPVDARAEFPNSNEAEGLEGLQAYIRANRETDFVENLCRKTLAYALGRTLMLSDEPTIEGMRARMAATRNRFSTLVESIVTSSQFVTKRDPDASE